MSDLISRQKAINVFEILADKMTDEGKTVMEQAVAVLKDLPSAEPERKTGEWRHLGDDEWCCTNCGYVVSTEGSWEHPKEQGKDYCEHCGADMRGEYE